MLYILLGKISADNNNEFHILSIVPCLYVARAVDADKLGGYAASAYLRKDEVPNVNTAYTEKEWLSPGTFNWVVPEGVNSILVTTVGGGGSSGMIYFQDSSSRWYIYSTGGGGGAVTPQVSINVTPGETLQVVVGSKGYGRYSENYKIWKYVQNIVGTDGSPSYIKRNGVIIGSTVAYGGHGGEGYPYFMRYGNMGRYDNYGAWGGAYGGPGGGSGGALLNYVTANTNNISGHYNSPGSGAGNYGKTAGVVTVSPIYINEHTDSDGWWRGGYYGASPGGSSWGAGCRNSADGRSIEEAGTGGGGCHSSYFIYSSSAGNGMVKILAIGTTMTN